MTSHPLPLTMPDAALLSIGPTLSPPRVSSTLAVQDVSYRAAGGKMLLAGVSARLIPGRLLAVVGPNGAGKTTLLRVFASELQPARGHVLLDDGPLARWSARERARRIAVLPQQSALSAPLTGLEVALLGRSPHPTRGGRSADLVLAHEALMLMDAGHLAARLFPSLSGGEKSRVQAARVLTQILEPGFAARHPDFPIPPARFLLLDEPTASLDCAHQHQLLGRVRQVARTQNIGVLAVLHDLNLAAQYADELLALKDGQTYASGPTHAVFQADMLSAVFGLPMLVIPHPLHGWPMAVPG